MAAHGGAIDHVLPVVCQYQFDQCRQDCIPYTLFDPATEAHIDQISKAVAFMHISPWASYAQHMQHTVEKSSIIMGWARFAAAF